VDILQWANFIMAERFLQYAHMLGCGQGLPYAIMSEGKHGGCNSYKIS